MQMHYAQSWSHGASPSIDIDNLVDTARYCANCMNTLRRSARNIHSIACCTPAAGCQFMTDTIVHVSVYLLLGKVSQIWPSTHPYFKEALDVRQEKLGK